MTLNPRDYDLNELRGMSGDGDTGFEFGIEPEPPRLRADDVLRSNQRRELLLLEAAATDDERTKPYLTTLSGTYAVEVLVFEWLEYLVTKGGYAAATDAISFYVSIGWITDDVEATLREYLRGVDANPERPSSRLDMDDHVLSLIYIARLASMM